MEIGQVQLTDKAKGKAFRMLSPGLIREKLRELEGTLYESETEPNTYVLNTETPREEEKVLIMFREQDGVGHNTDA